MYFCRNRDGALTAILYQVHNTHGEQHTYAVPVTKDERVIQQRVEKAFYVSPFIGPTSTYNFRIISPGDTTSVVIRQECGGELLMAASFRGIRRSFVSRTIVRLLCLVPLMTLKVIVAIHWEEIKLWSKGFEIFPHTPQRKPKP